MTEERRSAPRARLSGARVTYESAAGDHLETNALNIGRGGLFLSAAKPLAVGKRIALEIQVAGEPTAWSALGRVIWVRTESDDPQRPSGMGVKLIDADDPMLDAIDRLLPQEEPPGQAAAARATPPPKREPTIVGVGSPNETSIPTPIVAVVPARERTVLGIGMSPPVSEPVQAPDQSARRESYPPHQPAPTREPSVAREPSVVIDLVDSVDPQPPVRQQGTAVSDLPTEVRRRGRGRWGLVLAFLVLAAVGAYAFLGSDLDRLQRLVGPAAAPAPAPSAAVIPQPSTSPTIVAWPNASPFSSGPASASASAHSIGSPSATQPGHMPAIPNLTSPSSASARSTTMTGVSAPETPEPKKASGSSSATQPRAPKKASPAEDNPY